MLLRGVKFATPMLNSADARAVKGRAQHTGRSFGGAPLNGRGRGGRMDYGSDRPNPFAAHLDPRFMGAPAGGIPMMPPGWVPPVPGSGDFSRGPPGPPRGGGSYYPPNQGHQQRPGDYYGQRGGSYNQGSYHGHPGGYGDSRGGRGGGGGYRGGKFRGQDRDHYGGYRGGGYGRY